SPATRADNGSIDRARWGTRSGATSLGAVSHVDLSPHPGGGSVTASVKMPEAQTAVVFVSTSTLASRALDLHCKTTRGRVGGRWPRQRHGRRRGCGHDGPAVPLAQLLERIARAQPNAPPCCVAVDVLAATDVGVAIPLL